MDLKAYMGTIISNISKNGDKKILADLGYTQSDKDCGYRSGLRYLGLKQTGETDLIAYFMIYGKPMKPPKINKPEQLLLFT